MKGCAKCASCIAFFKILKKQSWFTLGRKKVRVKLKSQELEEFLSMDMIGLQGINYDVSVCCDGAIVTY